MGRWVWVPGPCVLSFRFGVKLSAVETQDLEGGVVVLSLMLEL